MAVEAIEASAYHDEAFFARGDVLLIGGAASNNATLRIFNQFCGLRFRIDYRMPRYSDIWIADLVTGEQYRTRYAQTSDGVQADEDWAIVSVLKNPYKDASFVVGAMGVHGYGTLAATRLLCGHGDVEPLLSAIERLSLPEVQGIQLLISTSDRGRYVFTSLERFHRLIVRRPQAVCPRSL